MIKTALLVLMSFAVSQSIGQTRKTIIRISGKDTIITEVPNLNSTDQMMLVDTLPKFNGDLEQYLKQKIMEAKLPADGNKGTVTVGFTIDEHGVVHNPVVFKSTKQQLENVAVRIVAGMPKWHPAIKNGNAIASPYALNIIF